MSFMVTKWKRQASDGLVELFSGKYARNEVDQESRLKELHAKIGELTVEREFLSKAFGRFSRRPEERDGGVGPSPSLDRPAVPAVGNQPLDVLLRGDRRIPVEPRSHADHRRAVSGEPLLRIPADVPLAPPAGLLYQPQAGRPADAEGGAVRDLPETQHQQAVSRSQGLSVHAQGDGDRPSEPGLVRGCLLHLDASGVSLPRGDHGLAQPEGSLVEAVEHAGGGFLRGGPSGGVGPVRGARDLQHGPGVPVHRHRV